MNHEDNAKKPMIVVHDLWKSYNNVEVLKGLNLKIYEGETLVILGRSGVGKSVLLRQILGIELPDRGYVEVNGQVISKLSIKERYEIVKGMGMLFQSAALFDSMTVGENTAFYLKQNMSLSPKDIQKQVAESLDLVGLAGCENKMPSDLSGGMRKRAALARLIIYHPSILLYDEPTTGLDPVTAMQINKLINQIQSKLKSTSIVVTHDIRSALEVGDRLAFHDNGRIAEIAPKKEFLKIQDPNLQAFFANSMVTPETLEMNKEDQK